MTENSRLIAIWSAVLRNKYIARHGVVAGLCILLAFHQNKVWSEDLSVKPVIVLDGSSVQIKTPTGKDQVISLDHAVSASDISLENFTFGKYADLKILDTEGVSQKFYKVYLYDASSGLYKYSKELSALPCMQTDVKQKEIVGTCFHESACENWEERYTMSKTGKLALSEKSGTYCDATGQGYFYTDTYKNDKKISSTIKPVEDNPPNSQ
ncbi:XAC2610-related protein [Paraburkholderia sp. J63]|uniref:XAC2610-related protein n=1 Tax=Paraburkholderia sp. J63 TaxID=2805434 RepID=UPI002ABDE468|nr:hypothetical protein [Paraburkholderia sp. J63]